MSLKEAASEPNLGKLIQDSIPTCYAIMRNQLTNDLVNWNTKREFKKNIMAYILVSPVLLILSPIFLFGYLLSHESYIDTLRDAFTSPEFRKKIALCLPYAGCYEKVVIEEFKETATSPDNIFRTILCNRKIRDILSEDWIIGVVGKKKCGKSTFVEKLIPGANAQADATIATTVMSPYKIIDSVVLIDYPHFDSTDFKHKLQFFFTCKLLGHTFLLTNAMEVMDSDDTEKLFNIVASHGGHFTILLNKADQILNDPKTDKQNAKAKLDGIKNDVCVRRKFFEEEDREKVILTCLNDIKNLEELDEIRKTDIYIGDKLQEKIIKIILKTIPDNLKNDSLRIQLGAKINCREMAKMKKILIQNGRFYSNWIIAKDKNLCAEEADDVVDSYEDLVEQFRCGKLNYPVFKVKSNQQIIMKSIEDFLKTEEHTFIVVSDLAAYESLNNVVTV